MSKERDQSTFNKSCIHDDVIKWKHFPRNWPFVREIHRSPVNFPHKGQWRGALMFSLIYAWINDWVNNREAGDLRRQHGHYDVIVMRCNQITLLTFRHFHQSIYSSIRLEIELSYHSGKHFMGWDEIISLSANQNLEWLSTLVSVQISLNIWPAPSWKCGSREIFKV